MMTADRGTPSILPLTASSGRGLSRRALLAGAGAAAVGAMAGCGNASGAGGSNTVRVWIVPESPADQTFMTEQFAGLEEKLGDITIQVQFFDSGNYANALQLAFAGQGNDAPDIFKTHGGSGMIMPTLQQRGWLAPVTPYLDEEFRQRYPASVYDPETSPIYVGGEAWGIAVQDPDAYSTRLQLTNLGLLAEHGFDTPPATRSELRDVCAKVTADSRGAAYGTALVGQSINAGLMIYQNVAGPQAWRQDGQPPISLLTGKPALAEQSMVDTITWLRELHTSGVMTPGWQTMDANAILQQMASGRLATYAFPLFHVNSLRAANPQLNLAVTMPVTPDQGQLGSRDTQADTLCAYMLGGRAASKDNAWRVMNFLGSLEFQTAAYQKQGLISIMPEVYESSEVSADTTAIRSIAERVVRDHPRPITRNPNAEVVYNDIVAKGPKPQPAQLFMSGITQDTPFAELAGKYDNDLAAVMQEQFAQQATSGSPVDASTYTYPDWDPLKDYTG